MFLLTSRMLTHTAEDGLAYMKGHLGSKIWRNWLSDPSLVGSKAIPLKMLRADQKRGTRIFDEKAGLSSSWIC